MESSPAVEWDQGEGPHLCIRCFFKFLNVLSVLTFKAFPIILPWALSTETELW